MPMSKIYGNGCIVSTDSLDKPGENGNDMRSKRRGIVRRNILGLLKLSPRPKNHFQRNFDDLQVYCHKWGISIYIFCCFEAMDTNVIQSEGQIRHKILLFSNYK